MNHPVLSALRTRALARDRSEREYRDEIVTLMAPGVRQKHRLTADDVAEAAGISRARVYQILAEEAVRS